MLLETEVEGLDLLPSNIDLSAAEVQLVNEVAREQTLRRVLKPVRRDYDVVLIDCQPSLGLLTVNALTAADGVVVPLECEYFALRGTALLLQTIEKVQERLNPELELEGILATMYDARTLHGREVLGRVVEAFGDKVFHTVINRTVRFPETTVAGEPITTYASSSSGATAYRDLARELLALHDLPEVLYALGDPVSFVLLVVAFVVAATLAGWLSGLACGRAGLREPGRGRPDPRRQVDPFGAVAAAVAGFGWAGRSRSPGTGGGAGSALAVLAGPLVVLVLGLVALAAFGAVHGAVPGDSRLLQQGAGRLAVARGLRSAASCSPTSAPCRSSRCRRCPAGPRCSPSRPAPRAGRRRATSSPSATSAPPSCSRCC